MRSRTLSREKMAPDNPNEGQEFKSSTARMGLNGINLRQFSETALFKRAWSIIKSAEETSSVGTWDNDISTSGILAQPLSLDKRNVLVPGIMSNGNENDKQEILNKSISPKYIKPIKPVENTNVSLRLHAAGINTILEEDIPRLACKINHEERLAKEYKNLIQSLQSKQPSLPITNSVEKEEYKRITLNSKLTGNCSQNPVQPKRNNINLPNEDINDNITKENQSGTKARRSESVILSNKNNQAIRSASYDNWGTLIRDTRTKSKKSNKENTEKCIKKLETQPEFKYFGPLPHEQTEDDLRSITSLLEQSRNAGSDDLSKKAVMEVDRKIESNKMNGLDPAPESEPSSQFPSVIPSVQDIQSVALDLSLATSEQFANLKRKWSDYVNIPAVINYTSESVRNFVETADHVISNYMILPDDNPMSEDEMNLKEDKIVISIMRLLGVPQQLRHRIYQEALHNVQAIQELSIGTISFLNNLIDWITNGDCGGKEEILKELRILAFSMEADYNGEYEFLQHVHENLTVFADAVANAVKQHAESYNYEQNEEFTPEPVNQSSTSEEKADPLHQSTGKSGSHSQASTISFQTDDRSISSYQSVPSAKNENDNANTHEQFNSQAQLGNRSNMKSKYKSDQNGNYAESQKNKAFIDSKRTFHESRRSTPKTNEILDNHLLQQSPKSVRNNCKPVKCSSVDACCQYDHKDAVVEVEPRSNVKIISSAISLACQSIASSVLSRVQNGVFPIFQFGLSKTTEDNLEHGYDGDDEINEEAELPQLDPTTPINQYKKLDTEFDEESVLNKQPPSLRRAHRPYSIENSHETIEHRTPTPLLKTKLNSAGKEAGEMLCRSNKTKVENEGFGYLDNLPLTGTSKSISSTSNSNIAVSNNDFSSELRARSFPLNPNKKSFRNQYVRLEEIKVHNDFHQMGKYDLRNQVQSKIPTLSSKRNKPIIVPSNDSVRARVSQVSTDTSIGSTTGLHSNFSNSSGLEFSSSTSMAKQSKPKHLKVISTVPWNYPNKTESWIPISGSRAIQFSRSVSSTKNSLNISLPHKPGYVPPTNKLSVTQTQTHTSKITATSAYRGRLNSKPKTQQNRPKFYLTIEDDHSNQNNFSTRK